MCTPSCPFPACLRRCLHDDAFRTKQRCLYSWAESITKTTRNLAKERKHLRKILHTNGYPNRFISKAMMIQAHKAPDRAPKATIVIPCISGVSEEIRRICSRYNVTTTFGASRNLHSLLTRTKDPSPMEKQSMVVYQIPCSCNQVY